MEPKQLLIQSFQAAVAAADPLKILPGHLPHPPSGRTLVIGAGKAAASMALAVEQHWPRDAPLEGLVITRYRHGLPTRRVRVIEAGHPVPDEAGETAAKEILQRTRSLAPSDLLLALIISDVTGDDPTHIASGPCAPDPTTYRDALEVLHRYGVKAVPVVREHLERGARGEVSETPKPGNGIFARVENRVVATARQALRAAQECFHL